MVADIIDELIGKVRKPNKTARAIAQQVARTMRTQYAEDWALFTEQLAVAEIENKVREVARRERSRMRSHERRGNLQDAIKSGDFSVFAIPYTVSDGVQKALGDMNAADCLFVAKDRRTRAKTEMLDVAVFEAAARRLQNGETISDVYTAEAWVRLREQTASSQENKVVTVQPRKQRQRRRAS